MMSRWFGTHIAAKRIISLMLVFLFSVCFVLTDAWAVVDIGRVPYEVSSSSAGEAQYAHLDINTFSIPAHLGEIQYSFKGDSEKTVVHIQDAHCNSYAQHKISDLIDYLNKEYGISVINLEGGVGDYDLKAFTSITGREIRREVADYFVKKGEVSGAEFYAINNPDMVKLWGVENKELYLANLKVYRVYLRYKEEVDKYLKELTHILNNLKRHIYPSELLKIDMAYNAYKSGNMDLKEYLGFIVEKAREEGVRVKKFFNLYLLVQVMEQEDELDFKKATTERNMLVDDLKETMSRNEMRDLVAKSIDFKTKKISQKAFYEYLLTKARELGIKMDRFPQLSGYIVYVATYDAIDLAGVMKEMEEIEAEIKEPLFDNDTQRRLDRLSHDLALLKNIFAITLTRNDYMYYADNKGSFAVNNFVKFIEKEAPKYRISARPGKGIEKLDEHRDEIDNFYEYSFKRDEFFLENLRFGDVSGGREGAVLMTGGFHTENLCELLKDNGISYVSVVPKFTCEEGYESPYFQLLAGEVSGLEQTLRSALVRASMMAIASKLNSLGKDVWGGRDIDAFRMAVIVLGKLRAGIDQAQWRDFIDNPDRLSVKTDGADIICRMEDASASVSVPVDEPEIPAAPIVLARAPEKEEELSAGDNQNLAMRGVSERDIRSEQKRSIENGWAIAWNLDTGRRVEDILRQPVLTDEDYEELIGLLDIKDADRAAVLSRLKRHLGGADNRAYMADAVRSQREALEQIISNSDNVTSRFTDDNTRVNLEEIANRRFVIFFDPEGLFANGYAALVFENGRGRQVREEFVVVDEEEPPAEPAPELEPPSVAAPGTVLGGGMSITEEIEEIAPDSGLDETTRRRRRLLLRIARNVIASMPQKMLLDIVKRVSGDESLTWDTMPKNVAIAYHGEGIHKDVFRVAFRKADGEEIDIMLAAKKAKSKSKKDGDISSHEIQNLKSLKGNNVPRFGEAFVDREGRTWFLEEFIEGETVTAAAGRGNLTESLRRGVVSSLLSIALGLNGMVPRDVHGENFIIRKGSDEMVMVDIGDKRLHIGGKHAVAKARLLFVSTLVAQYGFRDVPERNYFIFDTICESELFKGDEGLDLLRSIQQEMEQRGLQEVGELFYSEGRTMYPDFGASRDNRQPLVDFADFFKKSIDRYLSMVESRRAGPTEERPVEPAPEGRAVSEERMTAQMTAALEVADNQRRGNVADWVITPLPSAAGMDRQRASVDAKIRDLLRKESRYASDTFMRGYSYSSDLSESEFIDRMSDVFKVVMSEMLGKRYSDRDPRAIAFVPEARYEKAKEALEEAKRRLREAGMEMIRVEELAGNIEIVRENMPANGVIDEANHVFLGKGLLNFQRAKDLAEASSVQIDGRIAMSLAGYLATIAVPGSLDLSNPVLLIEKILSGELALPLMEPVVKNWREQQEALLQIRRSL